MWFLTRRLVAVVAGLALALVAPAAAFADEPGDSDEAKVLVLQAIALVVNTPDDGMAIDERIHDALEAPKKDGVDLAMVGQAAAALGAGDLRRTRDLLQSAIGAGPYVGTGVPMPVREAQGQPGQPVFAVAGQAGTTVVLDAYEPDSDLNGGEWILLAASVLVLVGGVLLAWRLRPADSIRQLRRAAASKEA